MALDLQFGLEEYAGAFSLNNEDGALAVSSGRQGRAYVVSAAKLVDAAASGQGDGLASASSALATAASLSLARRGPSRIIIAGAS